ncbi:MAG TPA: serine/threonine-protein kinase [Polyangiaceae bacterium]|jgi:serine/threonine protein kinase
MLSRFPSLLEPRPQDDAVGQTVDGKYEIRRELGRGAGGVVYEARHNFTGRLVALKMLPPNLPPGAAGALTARLLREGRALAAVKHPCVVDILDAGTTPQGPYLALEMLQGRTLESLVAARGRLEREDAIAVALQLAAGLAVAHDAEVTHRDVKPGNVFIVQQPGGGERVKLIDFGIAGMRRAGEQKLTFTGTLLGTPEYMSPEQLMADRNLDSRSDIYALGVTLYECLTGRVPHPGDYDKVVRTATVPDSAPSVLTFCPEAGVAVADVVARAISRRREDRFPTVDEFAAALRNAAPSVRPWTALLAPSQGASAGRSGLDPRRRKPRAPYTTPALVFTATNGFTARVADISSHGLLLLSPEDLATGDCVKLRFAIPVSNELATLAAEVRWVSSNRQVDDGARPIGLELIDVPAAVQSHIESYVEHMNGRSALS